MYTQRSDALIKDQATSTVSQVQHTRQLHLDSRSHLKFNLPNVEPTCPSFPPSHHHLCPSGPHSVPYLKAWHLHQFQISPLTLSCPSPPRTNPSPNPAYFMSQPSLKPVKIPPSPLSLHNSSYCHLLPGPL